jgi:phosphoserine phosphatase
MFVGRRPVLRVRLVIFDVDGVLVPVKSSWQYLHDFFGVSREAEVYRVMFERGLIDYVRWMELDVMLWVKARGGPIHRSELLEILSRIEVDPEAPAVSRWLKRRGVRIALVSGGVDLLVSRVAEVVGADIWMANKLSFDKRGYLVPRGVPLVGVWKDKAVKTIARALNIGLDSTMFVGDSIWDKPAMEIVGYPVRYRDEEGILGDVARYEIRKLGELVELVKLIEDETGPL